MFNVGDRVVCAYGYQGGVVEGETGTVVEIFDWGVGVCWDTYSEIRHECGGKCETGHGWNVVSKCVVREKPADYGDFSKNTYGVSIMELIGG